MNLSEKTPVTFLAGILFFTIFVGCNTRNKNNDQHAGVPSGSQRKGMIVTSTGLVFCTAADGKIYAYDADNGKVLWSAKLPMVSDALPSMYELNGHHYLVVNASSPPNLWGLQKEQAKNNATDTSMDHHGGYIVYSLP